MQQRKLLEFLKENLDLLEKSINHLDYSYHKCQNLNLESSLTNLELESLEAFASRFARTADIFTQKIITNLLQLMQEDVPTFIDRMNFCEKIGVVSSADEMIEIRALRNAVAHEYRQSDLVELYGKLLENKPKLAESIGLTRSFIRSRYDYLL